MLSPESGKGLARLRTMKFPVGRDHARVAWASTVRGFGSGAILLKYLVEPRLDGAVVGLDVIEVDRQRLDAGERRQTGWRRHVRTGRVDAAGRDRRLRGRRDHELGEQLRGIRAFGS